MLLAQGAVPVGLFMALSGFVVFFLLERKKESYGGFIARRFFRIYPAYIVVFTVSVLISANYTRVMHLLPWSDDSWIKMQVEFSTSHRDHLWENIMAHAVLLHGLVPKNLWPNATDAFLGVAWSISTEWQFYLVAPFCHRLAKDARGLVILSILTVGFFLVFTVLERGLMFANVMPSLLFFHVQYFYLGAFSCFFWLGVRSSTVSLPPLPVMCVGLSFMLFLIVSEPIIDCWAFVMCCLYLANYNNSSSGVVRAVRLGFCNRGILYLGRISYSLYLVHFLIAGECLQIVPLLAHWPVLVQRIVFMVTASILALLAAAVSYKYIELPFINLSRRWFSAQAKSVGDNDA